MADDGEGEAIRVLAGAVGIVLPAETIEGVRANVTLLEQHAATLTDFPLPDDPRP